MKMKVIRSMTDANKLIDMGNQLLRIDRNRFDRNYLIFLFEDTKKLNKDLNSLEKTY